jgi:thymidine kinase
MTESTGRLEVIHGCMFGGKSTELMNRLRDAAAGGANVLAFKPRRDDRYADDRIVTHDGSSWEAVPIDRPHDLIDRAADCDVAGIDEIHFFDLSLVDACRQLLHDRKRLIVAGVDIDHRGRPFPVFPPLLALADETVRKTARCHRCGGVAEFTQRLIDRDDAIVVGGAESYEPRCRDCFEPPP